eukprot:1339456-Prymnesium_polylepis.1
MVVSTRGWVALSGRSPSGSHHSKQGTDSCRIARSQADDCSRAARAPLKVEMAPRAAAIRAKPAFRAVPGWLANLVKTRHAFLGG